MKPSLGPLKRQKPVAQLPAAVLARTERQCRLSAAAADAATDAAISTSVATVTAIMTGDMFTFFFFFLDSELF